MKDKLIQWAQAGDGDCAYKLATIYREEGNLPEHAHWLERASDMKNFDAMKDFAALLRDDETIRDYGRAFELYKELAETFRDEESMEYAVDMIERGQGVAKNDKDALNFILGLIDEMYNEIYQIDRGNILARIWTFQTRRHNECTWEYLQAVERRRIAARIRKILSEEENQP